jgi:hypothetical protein
MTTTKTLASTKAKPASNDAIALLTADHKAVSQLNEMFPKIKSSSLDMIELGARMAARKDDLLARVA